MTLDVMNLGHRDSGDYSQGLGFGLGSFGLNAGTIGAVAKPPAALVLNKTVRRCETEETDEEDDSTDHDDEEDVFLPLPPKRASKARFPPKCTVLVGQTLNLRLEGIGQDSGTKVFRQGIVSQVGIHLDHRETMHYQIQMKDNKAEVLTVKEMDIQFSIGTPIWYKTSAAIDEKAIVIGSQENVSLGLELFVSCMSSGLSYSIRLLSTTDMTMNISSKVIHGVNPEDVSFRSTGNAFKGKDQAFKAAKDHDVVTGILALIEQSESPSEADLPPYTPSDAPSDDKGDESTSELSWSSNTQTGTSSNGKEEEVITSNWAALVASEKSTEPPSDGKEEVITSNWAALVASEKSTIPPILVRASTYSTVSASLEGTSPESPGGPPTWSDRLKKASSLKQLNEEPSAIELFFLRKKNKKARRDIVSLIINNSKTSSNVNVKAKTNTAADVDVYKSIQLPSWSFGKRFLLDSIAGKNGSRLKALCDDHSCNIDFFEETPDGCTHPNLMAMVKGPSLLKITQCFLDLEEVLFCAVPPRLRACLLVRLGIHNDYREERSGIVLTHNPFANPNNIMEGYCAVSAGSHLRHVTILRAGPTSKPQQEVIGFADAKQWQDDLKHRFPTCAIELVDASDYRQGFPGLWSHIILASPRFSEVLDCRDELFNRLKRGR